MREGIYRLYRLYVGKDLKTQSRLVARFVLYGEQLTTLEDHDGMVEQLAPNGRVTGDILRRLSLLEQSPYWRLVHEDDIEAGEHDDLLPDVEDVGPGAWPKGN